MTRACVLIVLMLTGCSQLVVHRECEGKWVVVAKDGLVQSVVYFDDVCGSGK
jgi:hypothetical protein